ncbi:MAG: glycosyltransferase [Candidatus Omnitrophota bacterium]
MDNSRKIKVMHVMLSLEFGGAEKVAVNLINSLQGDRFEFSVCVLDRMGKLQEQLNSEVKVRCLERRKGIDFTLPIRFRNIIKEFSPEIIHFHNVTPFFYGTIGARLAGVKNIVLTQHGSMGKSKRMGFALQVLSRFASKAVAVSQNTRDYLMQLYKIDPAKIVTIENGVDERVNAKNQAKRSEMRSRLGIKNEFVIGSVARLSPEKDHATLFRAFAEVDKRIKQVKLVVVGDGSLKEELMNLSRELGIEKDVIFAGAQSDIPSFLNTFDLFVMSSYREGMPLTILEAMAVELPVVATDVGDIRKMLKDGETGLLVPPRDPMAIADAVIKILSDEKMRDEMGKGGRRRMEEKFGLNVMSEKYAELYTELVKK